jgi:ubiquinol-cytochrome c reductase subunit 8
MPSFEPAGTMGKHFGELAKIRGIIQYRLSPFEQRAFAGAISKGLPNILFRIRSNIFRVLPREFSFV